MKRYELLNPNLLVIPSSAYELSVATEQRASLDSSDSTRTEGLQSASSIAGVGNSSSEFPANSTVQIQSRSVPRAAENSPKENTESSTNMDMQQANSASPVAPAADDNEFPRDRFATPVTATRVDHGFRDVLGGSDKTIGRGTLGQGRGKGIRKALFAVDVPAEEDEDEVDTHVEHIDIVSEDQTGDVKSPIAKATSGQPAMNGVTGTNESGDSKVKPAQQNVSLSTVESGEEQNDQPITTADGVEFNV